MTPKQIAEQLLELSKHAGVALPWFYTSANYTIRDVKGRLVGISVMDLKERPNATFILKCTEHAPALARAYLEAVRESERMESAFLYVLHACRAFLSHDPQNNIIARAEYAALQTLKSETWRFPMGKLSYKDEAEVRRVLEEMGP